MAKKVSSISSMKYRAQLYRLTTIKKEMIENLNNFFANIEVELAKTLYVKQR